MIPAISAWRSESLPSVAETCDCESVLNETGSEPDCSTSAMRLASPVESPVICAFPSMPLGVRSYEIVGVASILLSRMTANGTSVFCVSRPRWASSFVMFLNAFAPVEEKPIVTSGPLCGS